MSADSADVGEDAERAELRELLDNAAAGLNPGEREVIELQLRQGLEVGRGRDRRSASPATTRTRCCPGPATSLRPAWPCCSSAVPGEATAPRSRSLLAGWDGRLTVPLRKQVHRHIERCATCGTRRAFELRPAMLLGLSPGAAMAAAAAESLRAAGGAPAALKAHTLALAAGHDPGAVAHRAAVLGRAGSFGSHGFPKPAHGAAGASAHLVGGSGAGGARGGSGAAGGARARGGKGRAAVTAGVLLAVAIGALAFALTRNTGQANLADGKLPGSAPQPGTSVSAVAAPGTATGTPRRSAARPTATPTPTAAVSAAFASDTPPPTLAPPTANPTTPAPPQSPTPAPPPSRPAPTPKPPAGTLDVFPRGGPLWVPPWGATIFLGAQGGPVTWSATVSQGNGSVTVSPSGGTLAEGGRGTVTITASQSADGQQVTLYPGGTVYTIMVYRGHHPSPRLRG